MLKKAFRLSSRYEFNKVRRFGQSISGKFFYLYYYKPRAYNGPVKVGIVVSKKFSKKAVLRNRLKRLYREIVRQNFDKIPAGHWVVVYPKFSAIDHKYEELNNDFAKTLQKILITP